MIKCIKSFKEFIPTWIICIFMFFGIFGWTFVIGLVLLIIQCFQRKKNKVQLNELVEKAGKTTYELNNEEILKKDLQIEKLQDELKEKSIQLEYAEKIQKEFQNNFAIGNQEKGNEAVEIKKKLEEAEKILFQKQKELEEQNLISEESKKFKEEISRLNDLIRQQKDDIDRLHEENANLNREVSEIPNKGKFTMCAGKYRGGIDIPAGIYSLNIISGYGLIEINKPDEVFFWMYSNQKERDEYGGTKEYKNLEINDKSILKISQNAIVEFSVSKKYNFSKETEEAKTEFNTEKRILEGELSTIKDEIRILNNELIKKYYDFSDYGNITSQDCKNKLVLLKQKEHNLREQEKDVVIQYKYERTNKTEQRIIRQMLRTFNCECDNITQNISLKNIDTVRRKIQNSFESINKLYLIDSAALRKDLLELKLEQATLMYTYELKYQQEKDIQKAIKEQMVEEAKAQREIDEQKKKIEKDLQQHLGEINRMMKYMQKTQIDAEKQLYMDKIKELEEKIKTLESDKETVLEREANAKAGFVYIISNIGSLGENIYKIGMTRRLEPMDRIKELSSASVPFEFDVHAMIFSSDAPELENTLHKYFADKAVNKVNPRKEFYNVDIDEIERVVKENYNDTVQFTKIPMATEYRQSLNMQEGVVALSD